MTDYGRPLEFGVSIVPNAADLDLARAVVRRADGIGLDLVGIQDHPYQWRFLETWTLLADLLARTSASAPSPTLRTFRSACRR